MTQENSGGQKKRIVILGGGFGGAYTAQRLEKKAQRMGYEVVLIDRRNYFIFTPLLVEAGTGSLEPRHAVVSIRDFLRHTKFTMAEVSGVDVENQEVHCQVPGHDEESRIRYDHLVVSLGGVTLMPPIPGLREYAFEMKTIGDSVAMRDRTIQMLEIANATENLKDRRALLTFVFVGGSYTGVEAAGEFQAFLNEAVKHYENLKPSDIQFVLVERSDRILRTLDESLGDYAFNNLTGRGVDVRVNTEIREIDIDRVVLSDGTTLPARTVVWCAGIAPNQLLKELALEKDPRGYLLTDRDMRVKGHDNIWGIGDCAVNINADGDPYPATAQHAVQQAIILARNIQRVLAGQPTLPCDIDTKGSLAAFGCYRAVAKVMGIRLTGFPAWWMWRSVYLMKMPTWSRRIRVMLDWTAQLFFKHDTVQLGVHQSRRIPAGRRDVLARDVKEVDTGTSRLTSSSV